MPDLMTAAYIDRYICVKEENNYFLKCQLNRYFKNDVIDLKEYPVEKIRNVFKHSVKYHSIDLSSLPEPLKSEIKKFLECDLARLRADRNTLVLNTIKPIVTAIDYFLYIGKASIVDYTNEDISAYPDYLERNFSGFCATTNASLLNKFQVFTIAYNQRDRELFEKDIWHQANFTLSPDRVNLATNPAAFCFYKIRNERNRYFLKKYIEYLITLTDMAITSIHKDYVALRKFCIFFEDKPLDQITRTDALDYLDYLFEQEMSEESCGKYVQRIIRFFNYLNLSNLVSINPFYSDDAKRADYNYQETALDDYVLFQLFEHIGKLPPLTLNLYLVNACCGIRVSEACSLKIGCLRKEKECCLLRYYSIKMRKDCYIIIPEKLYEKLKKWEEKRIAEDPKAIYMFPSIRNAKTLPYQSHQYTRDMKAYIAEWGITEQNGEPHHFKSHAYRHTLAKDLVDADIPIFIISQILSHSSIQMTLAYAEVREEHKQKKFEQYVRAINGLDEISDDEVTAEWLRQNLNKQMFPNGYCCLPCKMSCPHLNQCLTCKSFVTTIDFYDVHVTELENLKMLLPEYQKKGMLTLVATTEKRIAILEEIVEKLEETEVC